jgi:hypothetical protein
VGIKFNELPNVASVAAGDRVPLYSASEQKVVGATAAQIAGLPNTSLVGVENDVVGLDGVGKFKVIGPMVAIPEGGILGQYLGSNGAGGLAWFDMPGFGEGGTIIDLSTLAWTGWWNGDNYDSGTGIATGQASAGSSGGRNFTAPGTKPARGNPANAHDGIIFDGTDKHLVCSATLADIANADRYTAYLVVRYAGFGTAGGSGYVLPSVLSESGSYWAQGGADGATPKKSVAYHLSGGAEKDARAVVVTNALHLLEITLLNGTLSISVDGTTPVTTAAGNIDGLTGTLKMGTNYNAAVFLNAAVYEVLVSDADLSASSASILLTLANKYGIAIP